MILCLQPGTLLKTRLRQKLFLVNFAKYLRRPVLWIICKQLLLMYDYIGYFIIFIVHYTGK